MTMYKINPTLVYQKSNQLLVTFATEHANTDRSLSVVVRHSLTDVSIHVFAKLCDYEIVFPYFRIHKVDFQ